MTAGTAALLAGNQVGVIAAAVCGIMLGWVVAAVAFVPHALWVLLATPLVPAVCVAACGVTVIGSLLVAADYWFYGRCTVRLPASHPGIMVVDSNTSRLATCTSMCIVQSCTSDVHIVVKNTRRCRCGTL